MTARVRCTIHDCAFGNQCRHSLPHVQCPECRLPCDGDGNGEARCVPIQDLADSTARGGLGENQHGVNERRT